MLLTNLTNLTQPLIRYELADAFVREPAAANHGHLRARVEGRTGGLLRYSSVTIHVHVIRSVIVSTPAILDYQIRQTPRGIDVDMISPTGADRGLTHRLASALADAGLAHPQVSVRSVEDLDRNPQTGKLQRLIALPGV